MKNHLFYCLILSSCYVVLHCNQKTILYNVEETKCTTNSFAALSRLYANAVDSAQELINEEAGKILQN